jgi:hypothetical protein
VDTATYLNLVACIAALAALIPALLLVAAHALASGGR